MKKYLNKFWPFILIILIILVFFYPVWLQNKIPLPADFVVGTYYPWLDYKYPGFYFGVPIKNPITTDVVSFIFPMQMLAVDLLKQGVAPIWNNLILTGTPLLANLQSAPFSPTNFLYFLLPKLTAWSVQIMAQTALAAIFAYLLLREFKVSKLSSAAGGIFFSLAGFMMIWLEWNGHSLTGAFFPLVFLLSIKWLKSGQIKWGSLLALVLALQICSGYPQIVLYEMMALALIVLFNFNLKRVVGLGLFILLGLGLSAIQTLPAIELLKYSQRGVEDVVNTSAFLPWQYLITFIAPDYFGNHSTGNFWGQGDYTLVTGYSGLIVLVLAGIAIWSKFKDNNVRFSGSLVLLALFIALPNPISVFLKNSGFLALQAASAHRALVLSNLGIALLAGFGLDELKAGKLKFYQVFRAYYLPVILLAGFGLAAFYGLKVSAGNPVLIGNFKVALKNLVLPVTLVSISIINIIIVIRKPKYQEIAALFLIILAIGELFRFGWKFTPFSPKTLVFPETPVLQFLQKQPKPFRLAAEDVIPINMMMNYGIETSEGYDAVYPLSYAKYLAVLNSGDSDSTPMGRYGSITNPDSPLLDLINTKYVLTLKRDQSGKPDPNGKLVEKYQDPKFKKVFEDKTVVILENTKVLPRAFLVYDSETETDPDKVISKLVNNYPIERKVILNSDDIKLSTGSGEVWYSEIANKKMITVNTDHHGILFISDSWFPGWRAFVDGQPILINKADLNFMAVPISVGKHHVEITYDPASFEIGKMISLFSGAIFLCLLIGSSWQKKPFD